MATGNEHVYVLSALALFPILPLVHILTAHFTGPDRMRRFPPLLATACYVASWGMAMSITFGAGSLTWQGTTAGISTIGISTLVYFDLFNCACQGFSLRILVDVHLHRSLTCEQLFQQYGGGKGMDWFLEKRLAGLVALRLVRFTNDTLTLTRTGSMVGRMGILVKVVLGLGKGN